MKVLIVDDDKNIADFIASNLEKRDYSSVIAKHGEEACLLLREGTIDVCIIDWMMPFLDGIALVRKMRLEKLDIPVLILSAKSHIEDKLVGLRSGCDDYLTKPFAIEELIARVELLYHRSLKMRQPNATSLSCQGLAIDKILHQVTYENKVIVLQPREYKILLFLLENKDQIITRNLLLEHVWEYHFDPQTNLIDVHISRLRNKLAEFGLKNIIHTVRGHGYTVKGD